MTRSQTRLLAEQRQCEERKGPGKKPKEAVVDFILRTACRDARITSVAQPGDNKEMVLTMPLDKRDAQHVAAMLDASERPRQYVRRRVYTCQYTGGDPATGEQDEQPNPSIQNKKTQNSISIKIVYVADGASLDNTASIGQEVNYSTLLPVVCTNDNMMERILQLKADVVYERPLHKESLARNMSASDVSRALFVDSSSLPLISTSSRKDCGWVFFLGKKKVKTGVFANAGFIYLYQNEHGRFNLQITVKCDGCDLRRCIHTTLALFESLLDKKHTLEYRI